VQEYIIEADLMGRTLGIKNKRDEIVAFAAKSTKALIQSQARSDHHDALVSTTFLRLVGTAASTLCPATADTVGDTVGNIAGNPWPPHIPEADLVCL
jgi:hypothetical protein